MKNIKHFITGSLALLAFFCTQAQEVSPNCTTLSSTENVLSGEVFFNHGSASNAINTAVRSNFTVGQPVVGTHFGPELNGAFGFWSRFLLSPGAPVVRASEGDLPDRILIEWMPDPLSPGASSFKIYRNGALLATLDGESSNFLDFNVLAGEFYTYEVAGFNEFGEGYRGSALGFLNPNGVVTGKVESFSGNPVPGAIVTLSPTVGTALSFDGAASSFAEYSPIYPRTAFTLSCWVKLGEGNDGAGIFDLGSDIGKNWWLHTLPAGSGKGVTFGMGRSPGDVTELSSEFPVETTDDWHYIAASYSGAALLLYVDGELIETAVADIEAAESILFFGKKPDDTGFYRGQLDDVRFFDRQLPQTEIQMMMNRTAASSTPGLVSYWKFDEGIGAKGFNLTENKQTVFHCGTAWTNDKPEVVNAGLTDESGHYKIEGINYGPGTTFTATPSKNFYFNQSLEFNGVNQSYADLTDFDLPDNSALTVTVKAFDFSGNQAVLSKADASGNNHLVLCLNAGNLDLVLDGQTHTFGSLGMGFHHLAVNLTQSGGSLTAELYKDGNSLGNHTFTGVAADWTGMPWKIGAKADGPVNHRDFFTGLVDEAAFFNNLLSLPDIQAYANTGTDVNNLNISSWFCLNEGSGTEISDMGPALTGKGSIHGATWSTVSAIMQTLPHEFTPGSRLVTLNPSNTGVDQVDFTDLSTIPVSGYVRFEGTTCFARKVEILVNGASYFPQIFTDEDGRFSADFAPGGDYTLTPVFENHTFYPAFWELPKLSVPVAGILFQDQTKRKVTGQMAGGLCRKSVVPAGSIVQVKVATLNGCYEDTFELSDPSTTDLGDGKFTFNGVPPDSVTVAVTVHSNNVIYDYFQLQGAPTLDLKMKDDTTDFIYFAPPQVELSPLDTNACGDPMLEMLQAAKITVRVFEQYDGGPCYLDTALLTIDNDIASLDQFDTLMTEGSLEHKFRVEEPNIVAPFLKTFQVTAEAHDEQATSSLNAVVLGRRPRETTFTSTAPEIPTLILRDPPGDGSYAYMESGEKTCKSWSFEATDVMDTEAHVKISLGPELETGTGTLIYKKKTTIQAIADIGTEIEYTTTTYTSNEMETCFTTTKTITTSDDDVIVGSDNGGDVYMGGAMNFLFGITDELLWDTANCTFILDKGLYVWPEGFETTFIYTEAHIESVVIPNLLLIGDTVSAIRWEEIIARNDSLKNEAVFSQNLSFDAGVVYEESETTEVSKTVKNSWTTEFSAGFSADFGLTRNGIGLVAGLSMNWSTETTQDSSNTTSSSRTVGFHLEDDDFLDNFTINVKKDEAYGTPVFDLVSGQSSCPHEPGTQNRQEVSIVSDEVVAVNVSANDAATFELTLGNTSPSEELWVYSLQLVPESNPHGAVVKANGQLLNSPINYEVPLFIGRTITMSVERGPVEYDYENLRVALFSDCEFDHAVDLGVTREDLDERFYKELEFDVHFIEPCSPVDIGFPLQDWVLIPADGNLLNITVNEYDVNDADLELIRVQYRRSQGDGAWINIAEVPKDSLTNPVFKIVGWDTQGLQDGFYEIRALTQCFSSAQDEGISHVIKGRIERTPPEIFGTPEPADGVLSAGDEISITFNESIRCDLLIQADFLNNNNVGLYDSQTGELIDAVVTCSEDKIIIVPNVPSQFYENKVLRVEIDDIKDLVGNTFVHTDWEFFADQNPLYWPLNNIEETKYEDESKTVYREIKNNGGTAQFYEITGKVIDPITGETEDIPNWVDVFPQDGLLGPGEQQFITFEFDDNMTVGDYADTLFLMGALGDEPLPIDFRVLCRPPEWEINPASYTYSMNFSVQLDIEGELSDDKQDIVGAFIDGELRGMANIQYLASLDLYEAFLSVYSDDFIGGTVSFQIWDASDCKLYGNILESYTYTADEQVGTPNVPVTLHTSGLLLRSIPLHTGWNWISFNLGFPDNHLDEALASLHRPENDLITSQTAFANYTGAPINGWLGSLDTVNNVSMFQFLVDEPDTVHMVGAAIDALSTDIPVVTGWNWIGYLPQGPLPVDDALVTLTPLNGDVIKGQASFAQFVAGFGWIGSLEYMQAPEGYLLKVANPGTITYPQNFTNHAVDDRNDEGENRSPWTLNPVDFEHTMILVGMLAEEDVNLTKGGQTLGAFVDGEVRGVASALYIEQLNEWLFFLTVYANETGEQLHFKLYDEETEEVVELQENLLFDINLQIGSVEEPMPINMLVNSLDEVLESFNRLVVQPNPFRQSTTVYFQAETAGEAMITVTDALGKVVDFLEIEGIQGWNSFDWRAEGLASGLYFLSVETGSSILTEKVVLDR